MKANVGKTLAAIDAGQLSPYDVIMSKDAALRDRVAATAAACLELAGVLGCTAWLYSAALTLSGS